jgi:glycerol uptake facilitator-like aquaporin
MFALLLGKLTLQESDQMREKKENRTSSGRRGRSTAIGFTVGMMLGGLIDAFTGDIGIATILGMVLGSLIGYFINDRVHLMEYPQGTLTRIFIAAIVFIATFTGSVYLLERNIHPNLNAILPFLPALPGLFLIFAIANAISKLDELQRRIQVEAIAIGFGICFIVVITIGMLTLTGMNQPNWLLVPLTMLVGWLIGKLWTRWKYR